MAEDDVVDILKKKFTGAAFVTQAEFGRTETVMKAIKERYADNSASSNQLVVSAFMGALGSLNSRKIEHDNDVVREGCKKTVAAIADFAKEKKLDLVEAIIKSPRDKLSLGFVSESVSELLKAGVYQRRNLAGLADMAAKSGRADSASVIVDKLVSDYMTAKPNERAHFELTKEKLKELYRNSINNCDRGSVDNLVRLNGVLPSGLKMGSADMQEFIRSVGHILPATKEQEESFGYILRTLVPAKELLESGERYDRGELFPKAIPTPSPRVQPPAM